jgi:hypothetical protein
MTYGLFVCSAGIYRYAYRFLWIPVLFKGRNHIQVKAKCEMLKLYVYRPIFHVLSNGAHAFGVSLILCEDMEQTIHGNCAWIQPPF